MGNSSQWRIQDFSDGGDNPKGVRQPIILATFFPKKMHEIEKKLDEGVSFAPHLDPPMVAMCYKSRNYF